MRRRLTLGLLTILSVPWILWPSALLDEGEKLLLENKLREASAVFEQALRQGDAEEKVYLYLGVIYEKLGESARAIAVMGDGLLIARQTRPLLYFNIGNNLFRQGDFDKAQASYSQAIGADPAMADAYLNRANTRLQSAQYPEAIADYSIYLRLEPGTPQRPQIERVLALLKNMLAEEERSRQDAAARQKALMDDVLSALKNASSDARNIGADSEKVQVDFQASTIED
jgi:tetratricopeptide (TPR) repeat protein